MNEQTITIIKTNPIINRFLREESHYYKYLYRNDKYIKTIEKLAKEKYKLTITDKVESFKNTINLINTFMSVID